MGKSRTEVTRLSLLPVEDHEVNLFVPVQDSELDQFVTENSTVRVTATEPTLA